VTDPKKPLAIPTRMHKEPFLKKYNKGVIMVTVRVLTYVRMVAL
jgi:hypothetical protein